MPIAVRNLTAGPAVFFDEESNTSVQWAGAGDPAGEDVQLVPDDLVRKNAQFRKAMNRGQFSEVTDQEEIDAALAAQSSSYHDARETAADAAVAVLDDRKAATILTVACVGPGTRDGSVCGSTVALRQASAQDNPPLCATHSHLAHQYRAVPQGTDPRTHEPIFTWERQVVARAR